MIFELQFEISHSQIIFHFLLYIPWGSWDIIKTIREVKTTVDPDKNEGICEKEVMWQGGEHSGETGHGNKYCSEIINSYSFDFY